MPVRGYSLEKDDYGKRLRRIEGQVRGLQRMIDDDEYCIDVLTQIVSVTKALQSVGLGSARRARAPLRARRRRCGSGRRRRQDRRSRPGGRAAAARLTQASRRGRALVGPLVGAALGAQGVELAARERPHHERGEHRRDRGGDHSDQGDDVAGLDVVERSGAVQARVVGGEPEQRDHPHGPPHPHEPRALGAAPPGIAARHRGCRAPPQVLHDQDRDHQVGEGDEPTADRPPRTEARDRAARAPRCSSRPGTAR